MNYVAHILEPNNKNSVRSIGLSSNIFKDSTTSIIQWSGRSRSMHPTLRDLGLNSLSDLRHTFKSAPRFNLERFVRLIMRNGQKSRARLHVIHILIALHELGINARINRLFKGKNTQILNQVDNQKVEHLGKESLDTKIHLKSRDSLGHQKDAKQQALALFFQGIENIRPRIEVRRVRIAGRTYMVPAAVQPTRSYHIAVKWLVTAAKKREASRSHSNHVVNSRVALRTSFSKNIARELWDAIHYQGYARQLRQELHQAALANRAFYHYRWWTS